MFLFGMVAWVIAQPITVGIMPFANNSLADKEAMAPLEKGLAEMMTTELGKIGALNIIERADLVKVVDELGLSMSGMVDDASVQEAGKMLGAQLLLIGSFNNSFGGQIRIDTRLVRVETGESIIAAEVTGKTKKLFKLIKKLSFKIAEGLEVSLSGDEKKAINGGREASIDVFILFSQALDAEDKGDLKQAQKLYKKVLKKDKKFKKAAERLHLVEEQLQ